jgi:uncharacterized protein YegP (UPF0339 family)
MKSKSPKPLPTFASDQEAEAFVDHADLTEFDLSTGKTMTFERSEAKPFATTGYRFVISQDAELCFRADFKDPSGKILLSSVPFGTKEAALKAIQTFRAAISSASTRDTSDAAA